MSFSEVYIYYLLDELCYGQQDIALAPINFDDFLLHLEHEYMSYVCSKQRGAVSLTLCVIVFMPSPVNTMLCPKILHNIFCGVIWFPVVKYVTIFSFSSSVKLLSGNITVTLFFSYVLCSVSAANNDTDNNIVNVNNAIALIMFFIVFPHFNVFYYFN